MRQNKLLKIVLTNFTGENIEWFEDLMRHSLLTLSANCTGSTIINRIPIRPNPIMPLEEVKATLRANGYKFLICRDPYGQFPMSDLVDNRTIGISVRTEEFNPGSTKELFDNGLLMTIYMHAISGFYDDEEEVSVNDVYPTIKFDDTMRRTVGLVAENVSSKMLQYIRNVDFEMQLIVEQGKIV